MNAADLSVVLCRTQGDINLGLVCRACANLGVADLRLVQPACCLCSVQTRMFANHAQDLLRQISLYDSLATAVADCDWVLGTTARRRRDKLDFVDLLNVAPAAHQRGAQRIALVFGAETHGLTVEELRLCDATLALQAPGPYPSYNLSHAVAITLYVLLHGGSAPATAMPVARPVASHAQREQLFTYWLATLEDTGYFRRTCAKRFAPKLRRLLGSWNMAPHDVHTVWGMLAHWRRVLAPAEKTCKHTQRRALSDDNLL